MPSSILNSDDGVISGTSGLKSSGGDDGVLNIQNNGTTAVTVDASGNVGIGTTSPSSFFSEARNLVVGTGTGGQGMTIYAGTGSQSRLFFADGTSGTDAYTGFVQYDHSSNVLTFGTNGGNERARITSGGFFKASNNGTYQNSTGNFHEIRSSISDTDTFFVANTSASPYGAQIRFTAATPNNTTNYFLQCEDSTNLKCNIYSSGTVTNRTGTYNAFSDIKLKQDIVDASSQWDDIKALRIVKYRLKDEVAADPNYPAYIGLVAQEVEQVSAGLVEDCPDFEEVEITDEEGNVTTERQATGTVTKAVKYSILYMKAVKALQEAMERIETLEAKNDALEARIAALEQA